MAGRRVFLDCSRLFSSCILLFLHVSTAWAGGGPQWIEVRTPHFIVVSNAGESQAKRTAHQFELIKAVFSKPFARSQKTTQPLRILAVKDENSLRVLLPEFYEKKNSAKRVGVFLGGSDTEYIALRVDASLDHDTYEPFEPIYHEYVHYLTRRLISKLPLWMVEGLAEFYANVRIESKTVFIGAPSASNLYELQNSRMLPVEQLVAIDSSSSYYNERNKTSIFYAESWALVHYLYERDWRENTDRVTQFMDLMAQGTDQSAAAARTIGDPKSLNEPLQNYIRRTSFTAAKLESPHIDEDKFQIRPMSDAEAAAVRADFMARDQHLEAAQQMIEDSIKADPKLALAYETLAFIALQKGNMQDAEKWAAQSIELNPNAGRANFYYASSLLRNGAPDDQTRAKAETSLRTAIQSNPDFTPAYDALAYTLLLSETREKADEAYRFILGAIQLEPGNIQYRIRAVTVQERRDHPDDAVRAAQMTVSMANTPQDRAAAEEALVEAQRYQQWWDQAHTAGNVGAAVTTASAGSQPTVTANPSAPLRGMRQVNASATVEVLSNTGGADLSSYLEKEVLPKIQRAWSLEMLKTHSTTAPSPGTVIVEFSIGKDGTVSGITMKKSTEQAILDDTTNAAIADSSPFPALPGNYGGKTLALRLQCDYSTDAAQPENGDPKTKKK